MDEKGREAKEDRFMRDLIKSVLDAIVEYERRVARENAAKLVEEIPQAFVWADTKDGHEFWKDVCKRLERIKEKGF